MNELGRFPLASFSSHAPLTSGSPSTCRNLHTKAGGEMFLDTICVNFGQTKAKKEKETNVPLILLFGYSKQQAT